MNRFLLLLLCLFLSLFLVDFIFVSLQVTVEVELSEESPLAVLTSESLGSLVDFQVLVQVRLLSEGVLAVWVSALVGPLLSVDPEVVEEIVPFSEHLRAVLVGAAQHPDHLSGLEAFVLVDLEFLCRGNVLLDAYFVKVIVFSTEDRNETLVRD